MKTNELEKKIKTSVRKHYVRNSSYNKLKKQFDQLRKRLAKLEKLCDKTSSDKHKRKKQTTSKAEAQPARASTPAAADDLNRIKGIGPVLLGKLNNLGIHSFAQIAAWSAEDIERVSEHLDFKGRIEREEWIKQAQEFL
ncbi:MAG: hypothetical protein QNL62_10485 [Gammaproteobacteria bacterium]|nr:hypothetical protein [Gammaproteobacteria bacterium]